MMAGFNLAQVVVAQAQAVHHALAEVVHHHVAYGGERPEDGDTLIAAQVDRQPHLVAVQYVEPGAVGLALGGTPGWGRG